MTPQLSSSRRRIAVATIVAVASVASVLAAALDWGAPARAGLIALLCVALWLTELVPVWVPTLVLWGATPLLLGSFGQAFRVDRVLGWSADPVLALFFGGFALAAAATRHGADRAIADAAMRLSRGRALYVVVLAAVATALLSMWMSNIAAAALMLGAFRPIWEREPAASPLRRAVLLAIALGADVGGIATPVGTGPNGIAMAAVARHEPISFIDWMIFGTPLTLGLLVAVIALIVLRFRPSGHVALPPTTAEPRRARPRLLAVVFTMTVLLWLSEPLHGVRAWVVALGAVVALLTLRLLGWRNIARLDWATLLLIAGGIAVGALLDRSGLVRDLAARIPLEGTTPTLRLIVLCLFTALLSALMSNTGTAALLIPLAATVDPSPSTAVIVAVAASLGVPFVISTPPNAMAVAGGLRSRDLLFPGLVLMVGGCLVVALTGPSVLRAVGIR